MTPSRAAVDTPLDVLVVGGGLRAMGLLTATPDLFGYRIGIVDRGPRLGVGAFGGYAIESNSNGSDFFGWIDPGGPFGPVLDHRPVRRLRAVSTGFPLSLLADALADVGAAVVGALGPGSVAVRGSVAGLDVSGAGPVTARLVDGGELRAHTVVLATGIVGRGRTADLPPGVPVLPAVSLLGPDGGPGCAELARGPGTVCVLGASHSAFSVLGRLLRAADRGAPRAEIVLLARSGVKVFYRDDAEYRSIDHGPLEAVPDPARDRCPETGNLHRYSGLRNTSKELFHAVATGGVPGVRLVPAPDPVTRRRVLRGADVVVNASGYGSAVPDVYVDGRLAAPPVTRDGRPGVVRTTSDGRLVTGRGALESVFVMGMDPYPYRDNTVNPTSQYARRGHHLLAHLAARSGGPGAHDPVPAAARSGKVAL